MDHPGTAPDTPAPPAPRQSLFRHRDFRLLWAGDTVSVFGMQVVGFAMPYVAIRVLEAGEFQMGVLTALEMLAFLLIGLPAGAWVDRWRKKRIIVLGDLSRAALLLTIPLAFLGGWLSMWQLYVVAFLAGCITVFFDVANQSYLPEIVESEQISEGNAKLQASQQIAIVSGPALAGQLVRLIPSPFVVAVTAVAMGLSSLFVSRIRHQEPEPDPESRRPLVTEIREGLSFVTSHPLLRRIVMCTGITNFASSAVGALFMLFALRELGLDAATLGLVMGLASAGGLFGALSAERFGRLVGEGRAIPISALIGGVAAFSVPLAVYLPTLPTLMIGWSLVSWAVVVYNIAQVSFRQRLCPKPLLGRMNASIRFLVWGPMPIGAFLGGVVAHQIGMLNTFWIFTVLLMLACAPVLFSPLIRMRELPRELDALASSRPAEAADGAR
ncbi:MFS transporter [Ornithinimicrobium sp. Y1694]|uniref:MFS transporter n=1 Tax=Ornithinimicrobium sp. Y1694 TaxID=3418590 RepID=UPI003CF0FB54